ncbi:MAG: hypothetical protein WBK20_01600 [Spirochaetota bacterium]
MVEDKELQKLVERVPKEIRSVDDIAKAADILYKLKEFMEMAINAKETEAKDLKDQMWNIMRRYDEVIFKINEISESILGKIKEYAENEIHAGRSIEKVILGEEARLTFIADKNIKIDNIRVLARMVADGIISDRIFNIDRNELKHHARIFSESGLDGIVVRDTVSIQIRKKNEI